MIPIFWRSGDPAWTRGRRVIVIAVFPRGGVLVRTKDETRLLVRRCDLELPPTPAPNLAYVHDDAGRRFEVRA